MRLRQTALTVVLAVTLAACGGEATPEGADELGGGFTSDALDTGYENALSVTNQLALGTMLLDGTDNEIDPEQADGLLPLWQAMQGGVTAEAEAEAVLRQIEATMTDEQLEAIAAMELTNEDMATWMADAGFEVGPGMGGGLEMTEEMQATLEAGGGGFGGFGGDGEMSDEMQEQRATRRAEFEGMSEGDVEAMRATAQAGGGPGGFGGQGGFGGRGRGGRTVGFLVQPLVQMLEERAAEA